MLGDGGVTPGLTGPYVKTSIVKVEGDRGLLTP